MVIALQSLNVEKRYQVFVSSTFQDLIEERRAVTQSLLELDCIPSGMELFPAADEDQWSFIKKVIDDCDYYLVIIAGRYGSTDAQGVGYTEKEYDYAVSIGKPVIAFLHADPGKIPSEKTESSADGKGKLEKFREKARRRLCKEWRTVGELGVVVTTSYVKLIKAHPSEGWVRARYAADPEMAARIPSLQAKIADLEQELSRLRTEPPPGASELAQGNAKLKIQFSYSTFSNPQRRYTEANPCWDDMVSILGPVLFDDQPESAVSSYFASSLRRFLPREVADNIDYGPFVPDGVFQKVKVQLLALGLIEKGPPHVDSQGSRQTCWHLTPYGQQYVTKLLAAR